jgi:TrmH family RNA methyltransferase
VVDGPTLLAEALAAGLKVEEVFVEPDADETVVAKAETSGSTVHRVPGGTLARVTGTVTPQQVAAIAVTPLRPLAAAVDAAARGPLTLVLAGVADPGNAGTLLRAAEAAGAAAVIFCEGAVDPANPKCVRASAGALFHVMVSSGGSLTDVLDELGRVEVMRTATSARGGRPCTDVDLTGPVAIVLGNEAHGLDHVAESLIDVRLTIPMEGRSESLNVAMAGSILCYEALRQRRANRLEPDATTRRGFPEP